MHLLIQHHTNYDEIHELMEVLKYLLGKIKAIAVTTGKTMLQYLHFIMSQTLLKVLHKNTNMVLD